VPHLGNPEAHGVRCSRSVKILGNSTVPPFDRQTTPLADMLMLRAVHDHSPYLGRRQAACDVIGGWGLVRSQIWACSTECVITSKQDTGKPSRQFKTGTLIADWPSFLNRPFRFVVELVGWDALMKLNAFSRDTSR
jgi:hypothetical protein